MLSFRLAGVEASCTKARGIINILFSGFAQPAENITVLFGEVVPPRYS